MKKKVFLYAVICVFVLAMGAGCSQQFDSSESGTSQITNHVQSENHNRTQTIDVSVSSDQTEIDIVSDDKSVTAALYIGQDGQFKEYPYTFSEQPTPEQLIEAMEDITGWNLTLTDITASSKGGMIVSFAKECTLFTGLSKQQKEAFDMHDTEQLNKTILDSIQKTLQNNTMNSDLRIYYWMQGDKPLEFTNLNITIPMEHPYRSDMWDYLLRESAQG